MKDEPSFIKYVIQGGIPFGLLAGVFVGIPLFHSILWIGISSGLLFGIATACFAKSATFKNQTQVEFRTDEIVILSGPANHFNGVEARGGCLYLTSKNLFFKPHNINLQTNSLNISLSQIYEVKPSWTAGIIPNGLMVTSIDKIQENFVVNSPSKWHKAISQQLQGL